MRPGATILLTTLLATRLASAATPTTAPPKPEETERVQITIERADQLLAELPSDPWTEKQEANVLAWSESTVLWALLDLYHVTAQTRYIDEMVRRADQILSHRDDRRGFKDATGKVNKRWSIGSKYTVAEAIMNDASGRPAIRFRSTASASNNATKLNVRAIDGELYVQVVNNVWKRHEKYSGMSLDPDHPKYFARVINHDEPLAKPAGGSVNNEPSQLVRADWIGDKTSTIKPQAFTLTPLWYSHVGYVGIIYHPMLELALMVKSDPALSGYKAAAERFVTAAEESYADIADHWRNGPGDDEGYYIGCLRGGPSPYDNVGEPFNYLAKHACSELALFQLTGKPQYKEHAVRIATLFKKRLETDAAGAYFWKYWYEPVTTGWTKSDDISDHYPSHPPYDVVEDVSHGTLDIAMVQPLAREGLVFDKQDVRRFVKTYLRNVVREDWRAFNGSVDGTRGFGQEAAVFGWLVLAEADPKVYEASRAVYLNRGQEDFKSLARLLRWEKALSPQSGGK